MSTLAGSGTAGLVDGRGTSASFNAPNDLALAGANTVFVADTGNNVIRSIDITDVNNPIVTSYPESSGNARAPGFMDGSATLSLFNGPLGIAADPSGAAYVADTGNCRMRLIK